MLRRLTFLLVVLVLLAGTAPNPAVARDRWAGFDPAFSALAPRSGFVAAEVVDGKCETIHAVAPNRRLAIASVFKLYVLGALARAVDRGEAAWDEQLRVQEGLKSLPSGGMLYEPAGTRHTLRYYAERMIAESDNTATDHLIVRLGREEVEVVLPLMGHRRPALNTPFLLTREWFGLKLAFSEERVGAFLAAPDGEQRRFLETEVDPLDLRTLGWDAWVAPKWIDSVEWFASPAEVCRALATLHAWAGRPSLAPILDILALNRGGAIDARAWPYAGCKAGYEAGVYNLTWLLRRKDGRAFVLTGGFNDPVHYIDTGAAGLAMLDAAQRLDRSVR